MTSFGLELGAFLVLKRQIACFMLMEVHIAWAGKIVIQDVEKCRNLKLE